MSIPFLKRSPVVKKITKRQRKKYLSKLSSVQELLLDFENNKTEIYKRCIDPTIFAYVNLKNKELNPYTMYDYQDIVANDKARHVIVAKGRKIGMTDIVSIMALHSALFNDSWTIVVASKTQDMAKRIIQRIKEFMLTMRIVKYKDLTGSVDNKFELGIKNIGKKTWSKIISVVANDSARGEDGHQLILDEAAFIEDGDYVYHEVLAPIVTYHQGQIVLISTPPKHPVGFFWEAYNNPIWSKYHFPSIVCPRITEDFLAEKRLSMMKAQFQREYMGEFFSDENSCFSEEEITRAIDQKLALGRYPLEPVCIGIDWGETRSRSAMCVVKPMRDEFGNVSIKVVDLREFPENTDYMSIIRELEGMCKRYHVQQILADAGIGRGQISTMHEMGLPVQEYAFGGTNKSTLVSETKLLFEKNRITIPNQKQLIMELSVYEAEYNPLTGRHSYHSPRHSKVKDHLLDAFMLANYSAVRNSGMVSVSLVKDPVRGKGRKYDPMDEDEHVYPTKKRNKYIK